MADVCAAFKEGDQEVLLAEMLATATYKEPKMTDKIFKDECMYCFKTPLHPGGLYVCLQTFAGLCQDHIGAFHERTSQKLYLYCKQEKVAAPKSEKTDEKVTKLAIGVEGGFCADAQFNVVESFALVFFSNLEKKIELDNLSGAIQNVCSLLIKMDGAQRMERLEAGVSAWDGEAKINTKHLNLTQLENGVQIAPSGWKCEEEGCELTDNLWLNLTDGGIKCGRSQYIKEGMKSNGNNHMRLHYENSGYPLVVKLGTITKDGADLFSYDEDESVNDPNLKQHLAHFGIDMDALEKTEKSTLELELDLNQKWEWAMCQEDGENLESAFGPGMTGMINIGSSCYINASIQMLLQIPDCVKAYGEHSAAIFTEIGPIESNNDFNCQTAKVVSSLLSGQFSKKDSELNYIKPTQFKRVIGRDHIEFSTARQQDADEYIRYFFSKIDENRKSDLNPVDAVRFKIEHRLQDLGSGKVRYDQSNELVLSLNVPAPSSAHLDQQMQLDNAPVRQTVLFNDCLTSTFANEIVPDFRSPITNEVNGASKSFKIATFPNFLIIQLKKFMIGNDWTVKKMDVNVEMPDKIDLNAFKAHGLQSNEEVLPGDKSVGHKKIPVVDQEVVDQLCAMGFTPEASRRAVLMTKNTGIQSASVWIMDHMGNADINIEHPDFLGQGEEVKDEGTDPAIEQLTVLGFSTYQAQYALKQTKGNVMSAADWLLENSGSIPPEDHSKKAKVSKKEKEAHQDGNAYYRLSGFISHMGSSPHSGHYVAHLRKNDVWYLFNDEKVAISRNPPIALGYIYLYERIAQSVTKL